MAGNVIVTVLESDGVTETPVELLGMGRQAVAASKSIGLSTEDKAVLDAIAASLVTAVASLSVVDDWDSSDTLKATLQAGTAAFGKLAANSGVDIGDVDVLTIAGVAPAFGTGAFGATVLRTVSATDDPVVTAIAGTVDDGAADAGRSSKIAGVVHTALSTDTLEADGDRAHFPTGPDLVPYVRPHAPLDDIVSGNASNTDGTSTQVIAAQAAGIKTYLTSIAITNMHASTVAYVEIKDGATAKLTLPAPPGGCVINLPVPLPGTAATAWNFDPSAAVTTLYCSMVGFKSKV